MLSFDEKVNPGENISLKALTHLIQQLAEGNLNDETLLTAELSDFATTEETVALQQALATLRSRLRDISGAIDQVAKGDLSVRVPPASDNDVLGQTLSRALGNLRRTFAQVIAGAEALGTAEAQLTDTANNTGVAVDETVAAFGKVTSHTFDQFSAIKQVKEGIEKLAGAAPETAENATLLANLRDNLDIIETASNENAKITVGIRLTTNKMLEQVDRIVVTSRSLRGMTIGLQDTMAPYILASQAEREAALKIAYLPIADHLVLPLTYLYQVQQSAGLPLEIMRRGSWPEIIDALEEEADGALILAPLAIKLFNEGLPIKIIMATHRNGSGLVLKKDLADMEDLAGRTVAVPHLHSIHNVLIYKALEQQGIGYGSVEIRQAPPPLMPYFLQRGTLDGFVSAEPFPEVALDLGAGRMEFLSKDLVPNHMCCVLVVHEDTLERDPDKVKRLVRSLAKTGEHIEANPASAARDVAPFYGVVPAVMERVLTTPPDRVSYHDLALHKEEFMDLGKSMLEMGLLTDMPDVDALVDETIFQEALG